MTSRAQPIAGPPRTRADSTANLAEPGAGTSSSSLGRGAAARRSWRRGRLLTVLAWLSWSWTGWSAPAPSQAALNQPATGVIISEFLAANKAGLRDEDGDTPDWIELLNSGTTTVSLEGWFLSDNSANLAKWRFPNVSIEPNAFLLVYASGKNRTNDLNRLHTSFQLAAAGEFLALVSPETNVVSSFAPAYPPQEDDISYGRDRLSPDLVGTMATPTPGAPNADAGPGFAPEVHFSVEGGTFVSPFQLYLSTPDPTALIHYVVVRGAGSAGATNIPTPASTLYTGPIPITGPVQVRARAFQTGYLPGPPRTETYIQLDPSALGFSSDLPILLIHNLGQGPVPTSTDQAAYVAVFDRDRKTGRSGLAGRPTLQGRVGLNIRGRGTQGYPKSSFAVEFWDEYNQDKEVEVLDMPAESDWVLYAPNNTEPILIHNPLAREMSNILGRPASRTRFVEVFLNTEGGPVTHTDPAGGHYHGIYVLIEKIKRAEGRVNVASLDPEDTSPDTISGGYIFKSDDPPETDEYTFAAARQRIIMVYPGKRSIAQPQRAPQLEYLRGYFNSFSNALFGPNWTDPATGYPAYIDVDSWIDHMIVSVTTFNVDAIRLSGYFYKDRGKPLEMGPVWDCDRSLGSTDGRHFDPRSWRGQGADQGTDYFNAPGPGPPIHWFGQLFRDIDFWQRYIDRYQTFRRGPYSLTNLYAIIDRMIGEVAQAQPREQARWGYLAPPRGPDGTGAGTFATEVLWLKSWLANRVNFMDTNFLAQPSFSTDPGPVPPGFSLALSGPARPGTQLYLTFDGSDPRAPGGAIAPDALLYTLPFPITANTRVTARAYNPAHQNLTGRNNPPLSSPWSGLVTGTFVVETPPLIITEIMYHPDGPPADNPDDPDDYEWIELKNRGATPLNLVGFRIANGIDFVFTTTSDVTALPPGGRVVVVRNRAAFHTRYPGVTNVAGEYTGRLANDGDRLTLLGPLDEPILDFRYEDDWHPITDGLGFALAVADEDASRQAWASATLWQAGAQWRGSPGAPEAPASAVAPIVINEILANSLAPANDAIELHNPTDQPVNVGGWFLTDNRDRPTKYRIPANTLIPVRGYAWFSEAVFNRAGDPDGFALSRLGDEIYLFAGDGTNITGYFHGFKFGPSDPDVSFGRYTASNGAVHYPAQTAVTLGTPNAGPRVGPVVARAIFPEPRTLLFGSTPVENVLHEYLELTNITDAPVPLYDPAHQSNTWRLAGGVDYTFPAGVVMPPHGSVLLVRFDPGRDLGPLEEFRTQSGFSSQVPLYGPFSGRLGNADDNIELLKPGLPVAPPAPDAGMVPYIRVEQVEYATQPPWPASLGGAGTILRRLSMTGYANDPTNWTGVPVMRPTIVQPPWSQGAPPGEDVAFDVTATGSGTLGYQWRFNGLDIPGATTATLQITNVQLPSAGWYDVRVTDLTGAVLSPPAVLTLLIPPIVLDQPRGGFILPGVDMTFSVKVTNTATLPISYRWYRGYVPLTTLLLDSHTAALTVPRFQPGQAGAYNVVISNAALAQSTGLLSSLAPVIVVVPPSNVVAVAGSNVTLRSAVTGGFGNPVWLQWSSHQALLPRQTNATLTVTNVQARDQGLYTLYVTNSIGQVAAYAAGLGLRAPVLLTVPAWLTPTAFGMLLQGPPWQNYEVQSTTNLRDWSTMTSLALTNGPMPVLDPAASGAPRQFYRAHLVP